jgi:hypothetical protein
MRAAHIFLSGSSLLHSASASTQHHHLLRIPRVKCGRGRPNLESRQRGIEGRDRRCFGRGERMARGSHGARDGHGTVATASTGRRPRPRWEIETKAAGKPQQLWRGRYPVRVLTVKPVPSIPQLPYGLKTQIDSSSYEGGIGGRPSIADCAAEAPGATDRTSCSTRGPCPSRLDGR